MSIRSKHSDHKPVSGGSDLDCGSEQRQTLRSLSTWSDLLWGCCEVIVWLGSCTPKASSENKSHPCVNNGTQPSSWDMFFPLFWAFASCLKKYFLFSFSMFQMQLLPWSLGACASIEQLTSDGFYGGRGPGVGTRAVAWPPEGPGKKGLSRQLERTLGGCK